MDLFYSLTADPRDRVFQQLPLSTTLPSLTARAASLSAELSAAKFDVTDLAEMYRALYRKHFGRQCPTDLACDRNQTIFRRLLLLSVHDDIDPETYIVGNMHAMEQWLAKNPRMTFQPNMLSGPKAHRRYEIYVSYANRRKSGGANAFDSKTALGRFRRSLYLTEVEVGHTFCSYAVTHNALTWPTAIERVRSVFGIDPSWEAVTARFRSGTISPLYRTLLRSYGESYLHHEFELMEANAAVAVLRRFRPNFPDVMGCREFSWTALSLLLPRLVVTSQRIRVPSHVAGTALWSAL